MPACGPWSLECPNISLDLSGACSCPVVACVQLYRAMSARRCGLEQLEFAGDSTHIFPAAGWVTVLVSYSNSIYSVGSMGSVAKYQVPALLPGVKANSGSVLSAVQT